jgi:hypothetical protein
MAWTGWEDYVPPQRSRGRAGTSTAKSPMISTAERENPNESSRARQASSTRSKYGAVKTTVDGITFHSKKEAARYQELKRLASVGVIHGLELQPEFGLHAINGGKSIGVYRADFSYTDTITGTPVVEDVKGMKTPLYRWKKKHVEAQYGIQIREV